MRLFPLGLFLLAVALGVSACSSGPLVRDAPEVETDAGYPNHSSAQILTEIEASVSPVGTVQSDGSLTISSPSLNQDAGFSLRSELADSTTAVLRGPFGIIAARALLTSDFFIGLDQLNKRLYEGPVSAAERFVPGAGAPGRGARALFGLIAPEPEIDWTVEAGNDLYLLTGTMPGGSARTYVVDPALWRVVSVKDVDRAGGVIGSQMYEAFDTIDGVVLPRRVVLRAGDNTIVLEHRNLEPNPEDLQIRFTRPTSGYEVIPVD
ncbi:MAG: hypothetical protein Rubg2KO_04950 [Rubricoccaceae bacterium]